MITLLRSRFENLEDLRDYFSFLRGKGDVIHLIGNIHLLNDLEQIRQVMSDARSFRTFNFSQRFKALVDSDPQIHDYSGLADSVGWWLVFINGEEHLDVRKSMFEHLYGQDVASVIGGEMQVVLDSLEGRDSFDLIGDFCDPLISRIICRLAGVDTGIFSTMRSVVGHLFTAFEPYYTLDGISRMSDADRRYHELMQGEWEAGRTSAAGMLASLHRQYGHEGMGKVLGILEFFFLAGIETSTLLLCESIFRLMTDLKEYVPELYSAEGSDGVVEELVRMSSTASIMGRVVASRTTLCGMELNEGDLLYLNLAGANRDPRYFPYPDTIHPDNASVPHIAFGKGRRQCVGAMLARMELKTILPAFFERFASMDLLPDVDGMVMRRGYLIPGVKYLSVAVKDRRGI
jgi:cytochrome P450